MRIHDTVVVSPVSSQDLRAATQVIPTTSSRTPAWASGSPRPSSSSSRRHDPAAQRRCGKGSESIVRLPLRAHCADRTRTAPPAPARRRAAHEHPTLSQHRSCTRRARLCRSGRDRHRPSADRRRLMYLADCSRAATSPSSRCTPSIRDGSVLHVAHDGPYTPGGRSLSVGSTSPSAIVTLHACTIGDNASSGWARSYWTVCDQRFVMIGAGSVVPPGKRFETRGLTSAAGSQSARPDASGDRVLHVLGGAVRQLKNGYLVIPA